MSPPNDQLDSPDLVTDLECASVSSVPVLITAPNGLALELATRIHSGSPRRRHHFVAVECSRATTAAQIERAFESAAPLGTVFLCRVNDLPRRVHPCLLARITPAGVRVIAGATRNLFDVVVQGRFDEALFYRLNQIHLMP